MLSLRQELHPKNYFFTKKQIYALMLPLIAEQMLSITVGLADSMMVSSVGDAAISAVSLVDSISMLMVLIFSAMATGGAAVAGQYFGRGDNETARRAGQQLVVMVATIALLFTALLYIFKTPILNSLFGSIDADVRAATETYFDIVMASIPAIAIYCCGAAMFRAMGKTNVTLLISLLMNTINVCGNALLIFVFHRGVEGVAFPTLISRSVAAVLIIALLFNPKLSLNLCGFKNFRFEAKVMGNVFRFGVPSGIENGMFQLGKIVLYSLVSTFGTASIAANAIANTLGNLHCCTGMAINLGLVTVVSLCVGSGDYDQARYYFRKIFKTGWLIMAIINFIFILLINPILDIYSVTPEARVLAQKIIFLHGFSCIFLWMPAFQIPAFLRASGDASFSMFVSMGSMWLFRVLFAYILGRNLGYGVIGVWFSHAVIDWVVRCVFFIWRYLSGKWMEKSIRE